MRNLVRKLLGIGVLGLASVFAGCDREVDIELDRGNIDGTEIRLIENVVSGSSDQRTIQIYNSEGKLKAELKGDHFPSGYIEFDDNRKIKITSFDVKASSKPYAFSKENTK